jgi:hypothetical protein
MKAKVAICLVALIAMSLVAAPAVGRIHGEYQLEFGFAKRAIARETSATCAKINGCTSWSVRPCKRQSWHRVDCVSNLFGENGAVCSFVMIAVWPPSSNHLILHHKRLLCSL